MLSNSRTYTGRKLSRIFARMVRYAFIPIILFALTRGYTAARKKALDATRPSVTQKNERAFKKNIRKEMHETDRWVDYIILLAIATILADCLGQHKLARIGDQIEWMVENLFHRLSHKLLDIKLLVKGLFPEKSDFEKDKTSIMEICGSERTAILEYMQFSQGFKHYIPGSAKEMNLTAAVFEVVSAYKEKAHGLELLYGAPAENVKIKAHLDLVTIVLDELIGNAVKYTERGSVSAQIQADRRTATITVSDTGIGMSFTERWNAFELFYRAPKAKNMAPGNGVGLTTVKRIVTERYKGRVRLKSEPGKGTVVTVTLPRDNSKRPIRPIRCLIAVKDWLIP